MVIGVIEEWREVCCVSRVAPAKRFDSFVHSDVSLPDAREIINSKMAGREHGEPVIFDS
jgi:hypothetical protein